MNRWIASHAFSPDSWIWTKFMDSIRHHGPMHCVCHDFLFSIERNVNMFCNKSGKEVKKGRVCLPSFVNLFRFGNIAMAKCVLLVCWWRLGQGMNNETISWEHYYWMATHRLTNFYIGLWHAKSETAGQNIFLVYLGLIITSNIDK